jgi:hypothetical protein
MDRAWMNNVCLLGVHALDKNGVYELCGVRIRRNRMTNKEKIEELIQGIGSPYGEGATYKKCSGYAKEDGKLTHLDDHEAQALREDIEALIQKQVEKAVKMFVKRVKPLLNTVTDQDILETIKKVFLAEIEGGRIE